ncbi:type IV secretion system DNA-binding domain-containing protein [Eilatimonas milleporae]|uniref:Type IV conjugative transfer system coupling protein TraD n=1 Tax=Eilatimonas milleporae TaxID=911205 RepID=A0A3M0CYB1_9PROT|nr:type IV secretion system DNA-binding domain-containing protein [Eilatimonas milleporae]RMB09043.1 type IV conjugative transfer system coupling protein TraD [Eilatimonas milleporae]
MSRFFDSATTTFVRGAQTTIHEIKMMAQSLRMTLFIAVILISVMAGIQAWNVTSPRDRYIVTTFFTATFKTIVYGNKGTVHYQTLSGKHLRVSAIRFVKSNTAKTVWLKIGSGAVQGALYGLSIASILILIILIFFYYNGRRVAKDFHVRGSRIGTTGELATHFKALGDPGTLSIGGVRLPHFFETMNLAMVGASRTGKSRQIIDALIAIRQGRQKAVIYDFGGLFIKHFYRPGKDYILNPMDERSVEWRPWYDLTEAPHYAQQAHSLFPDERGQEPFWTLSARAVYAALTRKLATFKDRKPSIEDLLYWTLQSKAEDVVDFLEGTEATSAFGKDKTASSVMAHVAAYLQSFNYLKTEGQPFSLRQWVQNEEDEGWLFIATRDDHVDAVRPLISLWMDIVVSAIMTLPENMNRRIFYIIDELTTLNALPSLPKALAHAAKYGGSGIIGYQSKPLLEGKYGNAAAAISGGCHTKCIYRCNDNETCKWAEDAIGSAEQAESNDGISFGINDIRDGRSVNIVRRSQPIVMASEINNLKNLQFYFRAGSNTPVVPIELIYQELPQVAHDFIPRENEKIITEWNTEKMARLPAPSASAKTETDRHPPKPASNDPKAPETLPAEPERGPAATDTAPNSPDTQVAEQGVEPDGPETQSHKTPPGKTDGTASPPTPNVAQTPSDTEPYMHPVIKDAPIQEKPKSPVKKRAQRKQKPAETQHELANLIPDSIRKNTSHGKR